MGTIASPPKNEEEAYKLLRRVVWYTGGKKVRIVGASLFNSNNPSRPFIVRGAYLRKEPSTGWSIVVTGTTPYGRRERAVISQFNELEVL